MLAVKILGFYAEQLHACEEFSQTNSLPTVPTNRHCCVQIALILQEPFREYVSIFATLNDGYSVL